jgi:hypothetical protein
MEATKLKLTLKKDFAKAVAAKEGDWWHFNRVLDAAGSVIESVDVKKRTAIIDTPVPEAAAFLKAYFERDPVLSKRIKKIEPL